MAHIGAAIECYNLSFEDLKAAVNNFEMVLSNHIPEFLKCLYGKAIPIESGSEWWLETFASALGQYIDVLSEQEESANSVGLNYLILTIILNSLCLNELRNNGTTSRDFPYKSAPTSTLILFTDSVEALGFAVASFMVEKNSGDTNLDILSQHIRGNERRRVASLGGIKKANKSSEAKKEAYRLYDSKKGNKPHTAARAIAPALIAKGLYSFSDEFQAIRTVGRWLAEYEKNKKNDTVC